MKSAVLARASGAARVAGFSIWHLREKGARPFYSDTDDAADDDAGHVIQKNLHLLHVVGVETSRVEFPLADVRLARARRRPARDRARSLRAHQPRRGLAQQAVAGGALRRGGGVSPGSARSAVGRVVGTGRVAARAGGGRRLEWRGARRPADRGARSRRACAPGRAHGVGRHRARCTSLLPWGRRSWRSLVRPIRSATDPGRRRT